MKTVMDTLFASVIGSRTISVAHVDETYDVQVHAPSISVSQFLSTDFNVVPYDRELGRITSQLCGKSAQELDLINTLLIEPNNSGALFSIIDDKVKLFASVYNMKAAEKKDFCEKIFGSKRYQRLDMETRLRLTFLKELLSPLDIVTTYMLIIHLCASCAADLTSLDGNSLNIKHLKG